MLVSCHCAGAEGMEGVAWFVQVSDLHFSRFANEQEQLAKFGNKVRRTTSASSIGSLKTPCLCGSLWSIQSQRTAGAPALRTNQSARKILTRLLAGPQEEDFRELTARVLAPLRPQALVITGDLADSKTREARGQQFEEEWQVLCSQAQQCGSSHAQNGQPGRPSLSHRRNAVIAPGHMQTVKDCCWCVGIQTCPR